MQIVELEEEFVGHSDTKKMIQMIAKFPVDEVVDLFCDIWSLACTPFPLGWCDLIYFLMTALLSNAFHMLVAPSP